MNTREPEQDRLLDVALDEIRAAGPRPEDARGAEERVWQKLSQAAAAADGASSIRSCADFQRLLPVYLRGDLGDSRRLLLEDHLGECVPCRRAFRELQRAGARGVAAPGRAPNSASRWVARAAAAAAVFIAIVGVSFKTDVFSFETGGLIHVDRVEGEVFQVTEAGIVPVTPGQTLTLSEGQGVRTAKDSSAVLRLADDSRVEMRERSELGVQTKRFLLPRRRADGVIDLTRGSVIVEASDQGSGHLFLRTDDCQVSVTGTVFSVNHGVKGSRVSVIEGEVRVEHAGTENVLQPGQQTTTNPSLARVPVAQEIAWSADQARYVALLRELRVLSEEIDQVFRPGLRYSTDLLDLAPAGTVVYFSMPNLSGELNEAYGVLQSRIADNALLREWWEEKVTPAGAEHLERAIGKIAAYGEHLGEEVAMTLQLDEVTRDVGPLFLASLDHPAALAEMIEAEIQQVDGAAEHVRVIHGETLPASVDGVDGHGLIFWIRDDLLAASDSLERLRALAAALPLPQGTGATLADSAFRGQLATAYDHGVEWLVGVDIARLIRPEDEHSQEMLERLGMSDAQFVIGERRQHDRVTENRVVLSFSQPREKLAAWLDEPAEIGALDFVSPEANLVVGFATKDMEVVVGELFDLLSAAGDGFEHDLAAFESEHGIDLRRDFAAALGGEFVVALDGPVLPKPAVALILEVYDVDRLQGTLEWLVRETNEHAADHVISGLELEITTIGERTFYRIHSGSSGLEVHYLFDDGYGMFASSRGQLQRALANREMGVRLTDSPKFKALLPPDGQANFSGLFYHDLGTVLGPLAGVLGIDPGSTDGLAALEEPGGAKPMLAVFYGERDRIVAASMSEGGLLGSSFGSLSGLGGMLAMPQRLLESVEQAPAGGGS